MLKYLIEKGADSEKIDSNVGCLDGIELNLTCVLFAFVIAFF